MSDEFADLFDADTFGSFEGTKEYTPRKKHVHIDLSDKELTEVPQSVMQETNLSSLILCGNKLTFLPEDFPESLTRLDLRLNQITEAGIECLGQLRNLSELHLDHNLLSSLPTSMLHLTNLEHIGLQDNKFTVESLSHCEAATMVAPFGFSWVLDQDELDEYDAGDDSDSEEEWAEQNRGGEQFSSGNQGESNGLPDVHKEEQETEQIEGNQQQENGFTHRGLLGGMSKPIHRHEVVALSAMNVGLIVTALAKPDLSEQVSQAMDEHNISQLHLKTINGSVPSIEEVDKFIEQVELTNRKGKAVAVHCMAGMGRTGTLLACYFMKKFHFNAAAAIYIIRDKRPGSIETDCQEQFLEQFEKHCENDFQ